MSTSKDPEDYSEYSIDIRISDDEKEQNIPGVTCIKLPPCPEGTHSQNQNIPMLSEANAKQW